MDNKKSVLILGSPSESTNILYNHLVINYNVSVLLEEKVSTAQILKARLKKVGLFNVIGQVLFIIFIQKYLQKTSNSRRKEILNKFNLNNKSIPPEKITFVKNINEETTIQHIQNNKYDLIAVNGTRIISKKVLRCTETKLVNIHAGITPKYRGVHGAYWAIANNDLQNCGVTIHLVDAGIDTGNILHQSVITIGDKDNFSTYPLIQLGTALQYYESVIDSVIENNFTVFKNSLESRLWYHPTIWQYFMKNR